MNIVTIDKNAWVEAVLLSSLRDQVQAISRSSETARRFVCEPEKLDDDIIARHLVEHVFRIRMFRPLDRKATNWLTAHATEVEGKWSAYARSEAVHDRYFMRDLDAIGISRTRIDALRPLLSTVALGKFIEDAMRRYGALPVVLYSFWTEQNSDVGSAQVIAEVKERFGQQAVRGAEAHRALDEREDHAEEVTEILAHIASGHNDLTIAENLLRGISYWVSAYLNELESWRRDNPSLLSFREASEIS